MIKKFIFLFLLLFSSLFISCKNETENRLYLNKNWQYSTEGTSGPFYDISIRDFSRLANKVENKKGYIWLKCNFTIPEELQNQTLTCYLGVTKVADKVFINDKYVGKSGFFPKQEYEAKKYISKEERKIRNRISFLEKGIEELEEKQSKIEEILANPGPEDDIMELTRAYLENKRELDFKMEEWEKLNESLE